MPPFDVIGDEIIHDHRTVARFVPINATARAHAEADILGIDAEAERADEIATLDNEVETLSRELSDVRAALKDAERAISDLLWVLDDIDMMNLAAPAEQLRAALTYVQDSARVKLAAARGEKS